VRALRAVVFAVLVSVLTALAFVMASASLVLDLLDRRRGRIPGWVHRIWGRALVWSAGARLVVVGAERFAPREARVVVSTHSSYLDIPAMCAAFPGSLRIVARRSLAWIPFAGWYLLYGHFLIDRDDPRKGLALLERVAARIRRYGMSPLLFPEGTRSPDGRLGDLKPGMFLLPLTAGVPIQPCAVLGSHAVMPKGAWGPPPARKALAAAVRKSFLDLGAPGDA
jgi:1-acyl-sn-glycerol-3-phosphate acyltransferase